MKLEKEKNAAETVLKDAVGKEALLKDEENRISIGAVRLEKEKADFKKWSSSEKTKIENKVTKLANLERSYNDRLSQITAIAGAK